MLTNHFNARVPVHSSIIAMLNRSNVAVINRLYECFARRDYISMRELFHPDVEWIQMPGFPGGGTWRGFDDIVSFVFNGFRQEWLNWKAITESILDAKNSVLVTGRYRGTCIASGKQLDADFAHHYTIENGRILRFRQYTDTALIREAMRVEQRDR